MIEEHDFVLEIDNFGKKYNEHYIGLLQNGLTQKVIFTALEAENSNPLDKISIGVAIAKIKDENDDGGIYLRPPLPKKPILFEY